MMFKILQARLQQYVPGELPDVQVRFRKGRGTREQTVNIHWIIEKARKFQKNIYFCFTDYTKAFDYVDHNELENPQRSPYLSPEKPICGSRMGHEQWTGSKLGKEYDCILSPC